MSDAAKNKQANKLYPTNSLYCINFLGIGLKKKKRVQFHIFKNQNLPLLTKVPQNLPTWVFCFYFLV